MLNKILDIEHLLDRKPKALSGGQRQRVAMGRAIVRDDLRHVIPELQKLGVRVIATSLHNASSIDDIKSTEQKVKKLCLFLFPQFEYRNHTAIPAFYQLFQTSVL